MSCQNLTQEYAPTWTNRILYSFYNLFSTIGQRCQSMWSRIQQWICCSRYPKVRLAWSCESSRTAWSIGRSSYYISRRLWKRYRISEKSSPCIIRNRSYKWRLSMSRNRAKVSLKRWHTKYVVEWRWSVVLLEYITLQIIELYFKENNLRIEMIEITEIFDRDVCKWLLDWFIFSCLNPELLYIIFQPVKVNVIANIINNK